MVNAVRSMLWDVVPFGVTLLIASVFVTGLGDRRAPELEEPETSQSGALQLVGRTIATTALIEAQSRAPIVEQARTIRDTAVVILLGAIGCSLNQMSVLQHWLEPPAESGVSGHPVPAIHADPIMDPATAAYESLLLRRVSRVAFSFLVSTDTTFNPWAMGIRTPQVVLMESGVITQVIDSAPGSQPPFPVLQRLPM